MSHQVVCPSCGNRLPVDPSLLGRQIRCGACKVVIDVPKTLAPIRSAAPRPTPTRRPAAARPTPSGRPAKSQSRTAAATRPVNPASNPYRNPPAEKPVNLAPIVWTAVIGLVSLILVGGGTLAFQFYLDYRSDTEVAEADSVDEEPVASSEVRSSPGSRIGTLPRSASVNDKTSGDGSTFSSAPPDTRTQVAPGPGSETSYAGSSERQIETVSPSAPGPTMGDSHVDAPATMPGGAPPPTSSSSFGDPSGVSSGSGSSNRSAGRLPIAGPRQRVLRPPSEEGLSRIHLPEGYSIALPPGFVAAPRSINRMTAIYSLSRNDGLTVVINITDDRNVTADSPVPGELSRGTRDEKTSVRPRTYPSNPNLIETFKLDGMNACFADMEQDISHPDMTDYYQRLFSGAIPSDVKRQLAPQMRAVTAFRAATIMKAMDKQRIIDVVMMGTSDQPRAPSKDWFQILCTFRHENPPDPRRVPVAFRKKP